MSAKYNQTLTLADGRTLGFAEFGVPSGYPLFFFHGFPTSRLEAWGAHLFAQRHGIRIVSPDRPGFGLSSPQPNRRIRDWPADVDALATHLEIPRFAVLGGSGGGPYALACAYAFPERLSAVGLMGSATPWTVGTQDLPYESRATSALATHFPTGLGMASSVLIGGMQWAANTQMAARRVDRWIESQKKDKDDDVTTEEKRQWMYRVAFGGFNQGTGAFVEEARLLSHDWEIPFEEIKPKVLLWHGKQDWQAPIRPLRYMADKIPNSVLHEIDGNHFAVASHLEDILTELVTGEMVAAHNAKA